MYGRLSAVLQDKGRQIYTTSAAATVQEAVRVMNEKGVGSLLVVNAGSLDGIITERDVLRRVVDSGRHPALTRVGDVMTAEPLSVPADMRVEEAMTLMTDRRLRHLPVGGPGGELLGVVSIGDLLRWVSLHQQEHIQRMAEYITGAEPLVAAVDD